ncbi:MAG TPA: hypothetical protein DCS17_07510 [Flavobacterium sp.]|nr:hypothetical protein [Flavobacterium sp.]
MSHQTEIKAFLSTVNEATLSEINANVAFAQSYYHNAKLYVGQVLTRMVANGSVIRVKKGVFRLATKEETAQKKAVSGLYNNSIENNPTLF